MTSASKVGSGSLRDRLTVKNGANRTLRCTRATRAPLRGGCPRPRGRPAPAIAAATSSGGVRFCWYVVSRPCARAPRGCRPRVVLPTPRPSRPMRGPVFGPNSATSGSSGDAASSRDGVDAERGQPLRDPVADAPELLGGPLAHHLEPVLPGQPEHAARLAELGRDLGAHLVVTDADRAVQLGRAEHRRLNRAGDRLRVVGLDADERLVPAEHLDHRTGTARRVSITSADAASYAGPSTGRSTASGHRRTAVRSGIPERTPNSRAS